MDGDGKTVGVLGGGSWGTTLAELVARNGRDVVVWTIESDVARSINAEHCNFRYLPGFDLSPRLRAETDLEAVVCRCQTLLSVIPSKAVRSVMGQAAPFLEPGHVVISATKGLEPPGLKRMSRIVEEESCVRKIGVLSGPNLAVEIMQGSPAATVVASEFEEVIRRGHSLLNGPLLRVYGSFDRAGVELCGALKNIYAIGAGMAVGMGFGMNATSFFLTRGLAEMQRIGLVLGAERETFNGIAGIGDLLATASSELSRNFRLGKAVAGGATVEEAAQALGQVAEGVPTTQAVNTYALNHELDMPQAQGMFAILFERAAPEKVVASLMKRRHLFEERDR